MSLKFLLKSKPWILISIICYIIVNSDVRLKVGIIHEIVIKRLCSFKQELYFFLFFLEEGQGQGQGQGQQGGKRFLIQVANTSCEIWALYVVAVN